MLLAQQRFPYALLILQEEMAKPSSQSELLPLQGYCNPEGPGSQTWQAALTLCHTYLSIRLTSLK